ncbi:unnamed protein product, partial [Ixodes persulcatus]
AALLDVPVWSQRGQRVESLLVSTANIGDMLEAAGQRDVALPRQGLRLRGPILLLHTLGASLRHGQTDVEGIRYELFDPVPKLLGKVRNVEAEARHPAVVRRQVHRMEGHGGLPVAAQVVDDILPESETGAPLGKDNVHHPSCPCPRLPFVQDEDGNSCPRQFPASWSAVLAHFREVQVGETVAGVNVRLVALEARFDLVHFELAQTAVFLRVLAQGSHGVVLGGDLLDAHLLRGLLHDVRGAVDDGITRSH